MKSYRLIAALLGVVFLLGCSGPKVTLPEPQREITETPVSKTAFSSWIDESFIVSYDSRRELDIFTSKLFPLFDYFVAPSHERTNWALGLGLPMFVVGPAYGPFAPINLTVLNEAGVAEEVLESAVLSFGKRLKDFRQHGNLSDMAQKGWQVREINGFEKVADFLLNYCL